MKPKITLKRCNVEYVFARVENALRREGWDDDSIEELFDECFSVTMDAFWDGVQKNVTILNPEIIPAVYRQKETLNSIKDVSDDQLENWLELYAKLNREHVSEIPYARMDISAEIERRAS